MNFPALNIRLGLILSVTVLAFAGLAGCGDSNDNEGNSGTTATTGATGGGAITDDTSPKSSGGSAADRASVEQLNAGVALIVSTGDYARLCGFYAPEVIKSDFGSQQECTKETKATIGAMAEESDFQMESLVVKGSSAMITFTDNQGTADFVKQGGRWYLAAPPAS